MGITPSTTNDKDIGSPKTLTSVQTKRRIVSIALVIDQVTGVYSEIISYQERSVDGTLAAVGSTINGNHVLDEVALTAAGKTEIDAVFTRAFAAL